MPLPDTIDGKRETPKRALALKAASNRVRTLPAKRCSQKWRHKSEYLSLNSSFQCRWKYVPPVNWDKQQSSRSSADDHGKSRTVCKQGPAADKAGGHWQHTDKGEIERIPEIITDLQAS